MNEILNRYGFSMYYECKVCGAQKKHYNNRQKPGFDIIVNTKTNVFSIFKNNMLIEGPYMADQLEDKLKSI